MEFTHTVPVPVTSDAFNLADWVFTMTDREYTACAKGHHAMGIIGAEKRSDIINVEQIAGTLIVQHYETRLAQPKHVTFVSEASEGFLLHSGHLTVCSKSHANEHSIGAYFSTLFCKMVMKRTYPDNMASSHVVRKRTFAQASDR